MKTEEELLVEVEAECPELVSSYYGRAALGRYLMAKQQERIVNEGVLSTQVVELTAVVLAREATICKLESVVQTVAGCIEGPDTCDGEGITRVSMPRRVVDLVVEIDTKITVVDVERVFREGESYVPLAEYYRREPPVRSLEVVKPGDRITAEVMNSIMQAPGRPSRASFGAIGSAVAQLPPGVLDGLSEKFMKLAQQNEGRVSVKTAKSLLGMKDDDDVGDV